MLNLLNPAGIGLGGLALSPNHIFGGVCRGELVYCAPQILAALVSEAEPTCSHHRGLTGGGAGVRCCTTACRRYDRSAPLWRLSFLHPAILRRGSGNGVCLPSFWFFAPFVSNPLQGYGQQPVSRPR